MKKYHVEISKKPDLESHFNTNFNLVYELQQEQDQFFVS